MPNPKFTKEDVTPIIALVEKHLRLGARPPGRVGFGKSAIQAAGDEAIALGWSKASPGQGHSFVASRLAAAADMGLVPSYELWVPPQYQMPTERASEVGGVYEQGHYAKPTGKPIKVCVIPDVHVDPRLGYHERLRWIGRWCAEEEPDYIVQLGDFLTLDSMSTHADPASLTARFNPSFQQDIEAGHEAMGHFQKGLGNSRAKKYVTLGNHEYRGERYEDRNPVLQGTIVSEINRVFTEANFYITPYSEWLFIDGVGFIHHVVNGGGKPYGGKTGTQRAAGDATFSFVHGHTHNRMGVDIPKIGPDSHVRGISAGCALPFGHVEAYARHSTTGWWHGVLSINICDGRILDEYWTSMLTLERKFAD